jgi:hypothetical protein
MYKLMASVLTLVVLAPSLAFGQQTPTLDNGPKELILSVPSGVVPASPIGVAAAREVAQLASLAETSSSPQALPPPQASQPRSWAARHPVALGSLIGLGVGFGIGAATCTYPGGDPGPCSAAYYKWRPRLAGGIFLGLIGAGAGAGIVAIVSATRR